MSGYWKSWRKMKQAKNVQKLSRMIGATAEYSKCIRRWWLSGHWGRRWYGAEVVYYFSVDLVHHGSEEGKPRQRERWFCPGPKSSSRVSEKNNRKKNVIKKKKKKNRLANVDGIAVRKFTKLNKYMEFSVKAPRNQWACRSHLTHCGVYLHLTLTLGVRNSTLQSHQSQCSNIWCYCYSTFRLYREFNEM